VAGILFRSIYLVCFQGGGNIKLAGELTADQISAEAVYTFIETTGKFECSNQLLNDINKICGEARRITCMGV